MRMELPPGTWLQLKYKGKDKISYRIKVKRHMSSNVVISEEEPEQLYDLDDYDWSVIDGTEEE